MFTGPKSRRGVGGWGLLGLKCDPKSNFGIWIWKLWLWGERAFWLISQIAFIRFRLFAFCALILCLILPLSRLLTLCCRCYVVAVCNCERLFLVVTLLFFWPVRKLAAVPFCLAKCCNFRVVKNLNFCLNRAQRHKAGEKIAIKRLGYYAILFFFGRLVGWITAERFCFDLLWHWATFEEACFILNEIAQKQKWFQLCNCLKGIGADNDDWAIHWVMLQLCLS